MIGKNGIPRIGIVPNKGYDDGKPYVAKEYLDAIEAVGGEPCVLDVNAPLHIMLPYVASLDAAVLTGGGDVNPSHYGQAKIPECGEPNIRRDQVELAFIDLLLARYVPMLGICRGIQMINVAMGGTLVQHIPLRYAGARHNMPDGGKHIVRIEKDSKLYKAVGAEEIMVNSTHHQCVDTLAEGLKACAWAEEGFVEAFEGDGAQFILGVQWHPERTFAEDSASKAVFQALRGAIH